MMSWTNVNAAPPTVFRFVFMGAVLYPAVKERSLFPPALVCFWSLAVNGYAYSYMPTMTYLYAFVAIVFCFIQSKKYESAPHVFWEWRFYIIFLIYLVLIDLITNSTVEPLTYAFIILCAFPLYIREINDIVLKRFSIVFMIISIVLSYYSISTQEQFAGAYGDFEGIERSGWTDPNYLAMVLGMGALEGFSNLIYRDKKNIGIVILGAISFLISIPAMLLVASRGAFTCLLGGLFILVFFTKTPKKYKLIYFIIASCFIAYLYSNSYFDLMEARIEEDDGTGSNRTLIWSKKVNYYIHEGNIFNYIFGFGGFGGLTLGTASKHGFHNDFVAFLVCYGFIGFLMFIYFVICPIIKVNKYSEDRYKVYANIFYIILSSCTLEPMLFGIFHHYAFLFYTFLLAMHSKKCELNKCN